MSGPIAGQPYVAPNGARLSIGDLEAAPGTDAYSGVVIIESGLPSRNIVDKNQPFDIKVYFKTLINGWVFTLPTDNTFATEFHIRRLTGGAVAGSPFAGANLVELVGANLPAGAVAPVGSDVVHWYSSTVTIPANTLAVNTTYRITVVGHETGAGNAIAFHDGTFIHTQD